MTYAIQWLRSLVFAGQMYLAMLVIGVLYLPWAILSPDGAVAACHAYCRYVRWSARWLIGLRTEVRGEIPTGEVMVAAKHQSFLDVLLIYGAVPRGKFIMKSLLKWAPVLGWFALRIGCVPVDRGKRGVAVRKMLADVEAGRTKPGQLIIYPQGTRVAPGIASPYKKGSIALYTQLNKPCFPVATNAGVFWPRRGIYRKPGCAVVAFLPPIPPGLPITEFDGLLQNQIETESTRLAIEAGFQVPHE